MYGNFHGQSVGKKNTDLRAYLFCTKLLNKTYKSSVCIESIGIKLGYVMMEFMTPESSDIVKHFKQNGPLHKVRGVWDYSNISRK
jgi:hypothetical protein